MFIRRAFDYELDEVLSVERAAFGSDEAPNLVRDLLADQSASPTLSLLAFEDGRALGHVLFTKAHLKPGAPLSIVLMAPLAVVPEAQKQGIGGELIGHGARVLSESGVDLVFVLGHPGYYPRYGFQPAGNLGFEATYPIPEENADAWMLLELCPGAVGAAHGKVICADALNRPECWRE